MNFFKLNKIMNEQQEEYVIEGDESRNDGLSSVYYGTHSHQRSFLVTWDEQPTLDGEVHKSPMFGTLDNKPIRFPSKTAAMKVILDLQGYEEKSWWTALQKSQAIDDWFPDQFNDLRATPLGNALRGEDASTPRPTYYEKEQDETHELL